VPLPPFAASGDLPPGFHRATLSEVLERFGSGDADTIDRFAGCGDQESETPS
jgi:hypothetical protein